MPAPPDAGTTLVVLPAPPGNLGDEAMCRCLVDGLRASGRRVEVIDDAGRTPAAARVVALGADVMDGFYSSESALERVAMLRRAAGEGAATALVCTSLNAAPATEVLEALRALPPSTRLVLRDPVSLRRARRALGRGELAADLAFLLEPDPAGAGAALAWVGARREERLPVVGLNANALLRWITGDDEAAAADAHARLLTALDRAGPVACALVPHDRRARADDSALAHRILGRLPPALAGRVTVVEDLAPAAAKALAARLDLVVTGRMHLAIAALGSGTPALCMDYQGKVAGLYAHVGLPGLTFRPEALGAPEALAARAATLLAGARALRPHLRARLPDLRRLAAVNLAAA